MRVSIVAKVKVNVPIGPRSQQAAETAAQIVFPELNSAFQDALGSKVWSWPRTTIRSNGQEAGSPRNIVDSEILKASNSFTINGTLGTFKWVVDYAAAVHYGASIYPWGDKDRPKVNLPPRPWTSAVLGDIQIGGIEPYDYRSEFKAAFIAAWSRAS